jgi:hypothetical protein
MSSSSDPVVVSGGSTTSLLPPTPSRGHSPMISPERTKPTPEASTAGTRPLTSHTASAAFLAAMAHSQKNPKITPRVKKLVLAVALAGQQEVVDKILKVVQYFSRFLVAFAGKGQFLEQYVNIPRTEGFTKIISSTRKTIRLFRLFRYIPVLREGLKKFDFWSVLEYWNTFVGMVNDTMDDIGWYASMDLFPPNSKPIQEWAVKYAGKVWFFNAVADLLITIHRWHVLNEKLKKDIDNEELAEKKFAELIYIYRFIGDVLQSSDNVFQYGLHKGIIGVTGMISGSGSLARVFLKEYSAQLKKVEKEIAAAKTPVALPGTVVVLAPSPAPVDKTESTSKPPTTSESEQKTQS